MFTYPVGLLSPKVGDIPRSGLVGEWLFKGNANDTSGEGNDGAVNGAVLTTGKDGSVNSAYSFTRTNGNYISIDSIGHLPSFSLSLWVKHNYIGGNEGIFNKSNFSNQQGDYSLTVKSSTRLAQFNINNKTETIEGEALIEDDWYHIVAVFHNQIMKMYINNGTPTILNVGVNLNNTYSNIRMGMYYNSTYALEGILDNVRMYNRELAAEEVTELYNELA